jgi:hypothetical protein
MAHTNDAPAFHEADIELVMGNKARKKGTIL